MLFNKLTLMFHSSVLLLTMNFVITLLKELWVYRDPQQYFKGVEEGGSVFFEDIHLNAMQRFNEQQRTH